MDARPRVSDLLGSTRLAGWIVTAAALVTGLHAALDPLWDADVWWILRAGQDLVARRGVPTTNGYSFTEPGHPWVMHEWLFGLVYALLDRAGALPAIALVRVLAVPVTTGALVLCARREARAVPAAVAVALALALYGGRFGSPRPVGMAYAFAAMAVALAFARDFGPRHALGLAAVILVWTNAHGSFPLGVAIAALGVAVPGGNRGARVAGAVLSALATLVNPYGLAMHGLAGRYAWGRADDAVALVHARVLEWWPLGRDPLRVATVPELAVAAVLAGVWLLCLRDPRWRPRALLGLALTAMALRHNRHLDLAGLLGLPLAAGPVDAWLRGGEARVDAHARDPEPWAHGRVVPLAVSLGVSLGVWATAAVLRSPGRWTDPSRDDEDLAALVYQLPAGARVFTTLPYTGYVLGLGRQVFWDTRNDCYSREVLREGFDLGDGVMDPAVADRVLRGRGTTDAVLPCDSRARRSMSRWRVATHRGRFCRYVPP